MNQEQLAHVLRAAAKIAGDPRILVIGSQAVLGTFDDQDLPLEATRSVEADIVFLDDPDASKADEVDGAIGEGSEFHRTYGYYGQGVTLSTAVLPEGWQDRVVRFPRQDAAPSRASCLEIYDIAAAKLVAGREKDFEYVTALVVAHLLDVDLLRQRCELIPAPAGVRTRVLKWIDRVRT